MPQEKPGFSKTRTDGVFCAVDEDIRLLAHHRNVWIRGEEAVVGPGKGKLQSIVREMTGRARNLAVTMDDQSVSFGRFNCLQRVSPSRILGGGRVMLL